MSLSLKRASQAGRPRADDADHLVEIQIRRHNPSRMCRRFIDIVKAELQAGA
jgi:hypothetical protein